jgi:predicted ATPase
MMLQNLTARSYRSLREETIPLTGLNLFIGANASGKSTILDALRLLHEAVRERDFKPPVSSRGGIVHLAWKGEEARQIDLETEFEDSGRAYRWKVRFAREGFDFWVQEDVWGTPAGKPPTLLLQAEKGRGWWWSGGKGDRVTLAQPPTACALAAAGVDESFPARGVAEFVSRWGFFDPSPFLLRRGWTGLDASSFDPYGRNLAERLFAVQEASPETFERIVSATRSVLGLPVQVKLRESRETEERIYFVQHEPGLKYPVQQVGASSGTLRILALMTALLGGAGNNLIGLEEPENHVHPAALASLAEYLRQARERVQILITTHSPLLLDFVNEPEAVCLVRYSERDGTRVTRESDAEAVRKALDASGLGLGEFYETKGFGG